MINVEEALKLLKENLERLTQEELSIGQLLGRYLSEDVISPIDMPPFDQSAMDGYALNYSEQIKEYKVIGEIAAGSSEIIELQKGEAVRIFTGGAVPKTANTVVKQEIVESKGDLIQMTEAISENQNIRPQAEQISSGDLAMSKGSLINPAAIGFLTGLGFTSANAYVSPKVSVLATGDELVKPGTDLDYGKIYESNSYMLSAALNDFGYSNHSVEAVADNYKETEQKINTALETNDVLILSGGISVGDYDFVGKALNALGIERIFYKVKQKPGKPIFFGKTAKKYIFALPGNPAAAMTSFYTYVLPALNYLSGGKFEGLTITTSKLSQAYSSKSDRSLFLKAKLNGRQVEILDGQSSAMLKSFAEADALVYIPSDKQELQEGEEVKVMLL